MANDDSTRKGFDLSPWRGADPLSIFQAAWLWAGLPPTLPATRENEVRHAVELALARGWFGRLEKEAKKAKAGKLPIIGDPPTKRIQISGAVAGSQYLGTPSRPAEYRTVPADDWRGALVALADLRAYAESIGQRPVFLFPKVPTDSPPTGLGASESVAAEPPNEWQRGIRHVAFNVATAIVANGGKLTADGLGKAMLDSDKVELKNDEYQLKSSDVNLLDRELKTKPKTIAGWVTELKKLLKQ